MGPLADSSLTGNLETGLRIFVVGFSGVFLNLALIMGVLRLVGFGVGRYEARRKAAEAASDDSGQSGKE